MKNRNYNSLKLLAGLNYLGAVIFGAGFLLLLMSNYEDQLKIPFMALSLVFTLASVAQAQIISLMLNAAKDIENIAYAQTENMTAIRKNLETQTNLLAVMAQHQGIGRDVLNEVIADINMEIPAENNNAQQGRTDSMMDKLWEAGK